MSSLSRRQFLEAAALLTGGLAFSRVSLAAFAAAPPIVAGKEKLIVRSFRFIDLETPAELLDRSWITPVGLFFVRNHMSEPVTLDAADWQLKIAGEVEHPVTLTLPDLRRMEQATVINTLECAGNGRSFQRPRVPGVQWERGAVGNARYSGVRMRDILNRAGVKPTGKHVAFFGLDEPPSNVPKFVRSIPIEKALDPDTLVATQMNGAPLLKHHGFPARALVPGWIGAASAKWLAEIRVLPREFEGNFMKPGYTMPNSPIAPGSDVKPEDSAAITSLGVKSIITHPADGGSVSGKSVRVSGAAWAGEAQVASVDLSVDGGKTWVAARLGPEHAKYAWRFWEYVWKPSGRGEFEILSRARDNKGNVQPLEGRWNPSGYLFNAADRVKVHVA